MCDNAIEKNSDDYELRDVYDLSKLPIMPKGRYTLGRIKGVPGRTLLQFAGMFDKSELDLMRRAIEEGREQIDPDEW